VQTSASDETTFNGFFYFVSDDEKGELTENMPIEVPRCAIEVERVFKDSETELRHAKYFAPSGIHQTYKEVHAHDVFCGKNPHEVKKTHLAALKRHKCNTHQLH
jgi:hypothetical protein